MHRSRVARLLDCSIARLQPTYILLFVCNTFRCRSPGMFSCVYSLCTMHTRAYDHGQAGHFKDHLGCCHECRKVLDCSFFTFDYNSGVCYLKSGKGAENPKLGLVSGMAQPLVTS